MRSEEEIEEMKNTLGKIVDRSPDECKANVYEECEHYFACLLWVVGEIDTSDIVENLLLSEKGKKVVRE